MSVLVPVVVDYVDEEERVVHFRIGEAGRGRDFPGGRPRLPESAAIRLRGERRSLVCSFRVGVIPRPRAPAERRS
jgi:hypothetical protein